MAFTDEQIRVLTAIADARLKEEADAAQREADIAASAVAQAEVDAKIADFQNQIQDLVDQSGLPVQVVVTPSDAG